MSILSMEYDMEVAKRVYAEEYVEDKMIELAKKMLDDGESIKKVMKWTKLSQDAISECNLDKGCKPVKTKVTYHILSPEEREQDRLERQEWARQDQSVQLKWAIKQSMLEIAGKLLKRDIPTDEIVRLTGLTVEDVDGLCYSELKLFS